jgi:hypothetical protein
MSDFSNYMEDKILNVMDGVTFTAFTPYAALFLLGSGTTFTATAATNKINATTHGKNNGDLIVLDSTGTLPGGLSKATKYYIVNAGANDFEVSLTHGGSAVDITDTGSGTHSYYAFETEAGAGMTEVSTGGYARQSISLGAASTVNDTRQKASDADVSWSPSGADYGIIGAIGIYDASSAGNLIATKPLTPRNVLNGDTYTIPSGSLTIAVN